MEIFTKKGRNMADETKTYPAIPASHWFALRKKFVSSVPKELTPNYVMLALNTSEDSALKNVIYPLRKTGIIDKDNKPTERAYKWRDNAQYQAVCKNIREEIYPQELLDLAPDGSIGLSAVTQWFANTLQMGEGRAKRIANFYFLLLEADPTKENEILVTSITKPKTNNPKPPLKAQKKPPEKEVHVQPVTAPPTLEPQPELPIVAPAIKKMSPSIHIDVHIHIPPEATLDQIDKIFESMGKHLKDM